MKKEQINTKITRKIKEAIMEYCRNHDMLLSDWFKDAIKEHFKRTVLNEKES